MEKQTHTLRSDKFRTIENSKANQKLDQMQGRSFAKKPTDHSSK